MSIDAASVYVEIGRSGRESGAERLPLRAERVLIGRGDSADIRLDGAVVSRRHAELFRDPLGRWWVRDLGSHNRTYVNGQESRERVLVPGDVIGVGGYALRFGLDGSESTAGSSTTRHLRVEGDGSSDVTHLSDVKSPRIGAEQLSGLLGLGERLIQTPDPAERVRGLLAWVAGPAFGCSWALMIRLRVDGSEAPAAVLDEARGERAAQRPTHLSATILRALERRREAVMAGHSAAGAQDLRLSRAPGQGAAGVIACPVREGADGLDALYLVLGPERTAPEWLALTQLAVQQYRAAEAHLAERARAVAYAQLEAELSRAEQLQRRLVPPAGAAAGVDVAIGFEPCRWVGGDFADAFAAPDGRAVLLIADVCGHGLEAALVSTGLHSAVRTGVGAGLSPAALMTALNAQLLASLPDDRFVTMVLLALDATSGELEVVNAGHMPPIVIDGGGAVAQLAGADHPPLGVEAGGLAARHERLPPGATLLLYTDGLTELVNGEGAMLRTEGLTRLLREGFAAGGALPDVSDRLMASLRGYGGGRPPQDDMTLLLARR